MLDLKYRFNGNKHFNKNVYYDSLKLLDRIIQFYKNSKIFPSDENNMKYFKWNNDHINRCYQMMKEMGIVTYARNHRRTTLSFLDEYAYLNEAVNLNTNIKI